MYISMRSLPKTTILHYTNINSWPPGLGRHQSLHLPSHPSLLKAQCIKLRLVYSNELPFEERNRLDAMESGYSTMRTFHWLRVFPKKFFAFTKIYNRLTARVTRYTLLTAWGCCKDIIAIHSAELVRRSIPFFVAKFAFNAIGNAL